MKIIIIMMKTQVMEYREMNVKKELFIKEKN